LNHEAAVRNAFVVSLKLLRTRRFGTFWFASLLSSIGTWAQQVAQPWLLLTLGASSFLVGLDSFAMSAPLWLLTLPGGVLADHADRRRVIAGFQALQMMCPIAIVVLLLAGIAHPWTIIVLSLVVGITDALSMPSFSSIVPSIVTHDQIPAGLALNSTQYNVSRIVGPALAGILMATVGAIGCFVVSAVSYVPFIGIAVWILPRQAANRRAPDGLTGQHPFAGLECMARQRGAVQCRDWRLWRRRTAGRYRPSGGRCPARSSQNMRSFLRPLWSHSDRDRAQFMGKSFACTPGYGRRGHERHQHLGEYLRPVCSSGESSRTGS